MAYMTFVSDLKKLGLSDKEASVYLAALGLGPSTVQIIARKAKVARATTYLVLEALMKQGLISQFTEGNKVFFVAELPNRLDSLLDKRKQEVEESRLELQELMPKLLAFAQAADAPPVVRYYPGLEGLKTIRSEMTRYSQPGDLWRQLTPFDYVLSVFGEEDFTYVKQRKARNIRSRSIFTTKSVALKERLLKERQPKWAERKFIEPSRYTSASALTIFRDRVSTGTLSGKMGGIIIESQSVAKMMAEFFDLMWDGLP